VDLSEYRFVPTGDAASARFGITGGIAGTGYDAVKAKGNRQPPTARTLWEDDELRQIGRQLLSTTTRDLQRNFAVSAWAIRCHLNYVSTFKFQSRSGDKELDTEIEALIDWDGRKDNYDAAGRFSRRRMIRMAEARRTIDGDVMMLRRRDGKRQMIEGDRVRDPVGLPENQLPTGRTMLDFVHGVLVNPDGGADAYAVHKRERKLGGFKFERLVPAAFVDHHGYWDRYDQIRGISPLAAAANSFRDVYENIDYALVKAKVEQLFALVFTRDTSEQLAETTATTTTDADGTAHTGYSVDFGRGPVQLDLNPGDDAKFLNAQNPSSQFQDFTRLVLMIALKSLDIPYVLFDESHANYNGSRLAILQYQLSADQKREDNRELLNRDTAWRLSLFVQDGELELPRGMRISDLRWQWIGRNLPWLDKLKEVTADALSVANGLRSPQQIIQERGDDPYEVIDQIAEWQQYLKEAKVVLPSSMVNVNVNAGSDGGKSQANGVEE
jgi:capsid protein